MDKTTINFVKKADAYVSDVIDGAISAFQINFDEENAANNVIEIHRSIDGENFVKAFSMTTSDKSVLLSVANDTEGVSKIIKSRNMPESCVVL